jgi:transcriptional regulator with GAF, ATPase, and Fis domain
VDQFRVATALREQSKKLLELNMRIQNALYTSVTLKNAFDAIMPIISETFAAYRGFLVILIKGTPRVEAVYRAEAESGDTRYNRDFEHHGQIVSLLSGKKYFLCNTGGIPENKIDFTGENTTALCIIPILTEGSLRGYVILESREESGFSVRDDSALCFISDTIAYIMTKRGIAEGPIRLSEDTGARDFNEKGFIL